MRQIGSADVATTSSDAFNTSAVQVIVDFIWRPSNQTIFPKHVGRKPAHAERAVLSTFWCGSCLRLFLMARRYRRLERYESQETLRLPRRFIGAERSTRRIGCGQCVESEPLAEHRSSGNRENERHRSVCAN